MALKLKIGPSAFTHSTMEADAKRGDLESKAGQIRLEKGLQPTASRFASKCVVNGSSKEWRGWSEKA